MIEVTKNIKTHYLYPSTLFASTEAHLVTTILGSCIAVCLYDTKLKHGAINHYMLPLWNGNGLATPKFGNIAIEKLIGKMMDFGSNKSDLIAKVFGGSNQSNAMFNIGERNTQVAIDLLKQHQIKIIAQSCRGQVGRKIIFNTQTSEVMMKFLVSK